MEEESRTEMYKRICAHLAVVLCGILFLIFVLPGLVKFFTPLIIAWIIAMIANPLVHFLEKRIKIMRKHGSAIVIVLVIIAISCLLYVVTAALFTQVSSMFETLPGIYENVMDNLQQFASSLHEKYDIIPANIKNLFSDNESKIN